MPCLIILLAFFLPRITLALIFAFSHYLGRAYQTVLWPLLGFFFMPMTTLAYAWAINSSGSVSGGYFVVVLLAALIDLGVIGGGGSGTRRRRRRAGA
jgi:hypothetical protein